MKAMAMIAPAQTDCINKSHSLAPSCTLQCVVHNIHNTADIQGSGAIAWDGFAFRNKDGFVNVNRSGRQLQLHI